MNTYSSIAKVTININSNIMKAKVFILIAAVIMVIGSVASVNATESSSVPTTASLQQSQTVTAYYYNRGVSSILIRVQGNYVVAYCSGRDYQGRLIWDDIQPVQIYRNNGGDRSTSNSEWYTFTAQKKNRARLGQLTIYF